MAMQINGNYAYSGTDYAERLQEKQDALKAEKAKEANKGTEAKGSGKLSGTQDEYIKSENSGKASAGLYRVGQDEDGNRKIFFDDPKAAHVDGKKEPKPEKCVGDTNAVEREIRKLKEKKQELEQQIQSASGDVKKSKELEKELAQVEQELSQKDNDSYRRQHTVFSQTK